MNTTTQARTVVALTTLALTFSVAAAGTAGASNDRTHTQGVCRLAPEYLPRTPDAVEGWLRHCSR